MAAFQPSDKCSHTLGKIKSWVKADSTDYIDWSKAKRTILPNLEPSTKKISVRLPELMIEELKLLANKRDIPYQSLKSTGTFVRNVLSNRQIGVAH